MLYYALVCLIIAIIAGVLGFGVIAGTAVLIAKVLFVIFLILLIVSLLRRRRRFPIDANTIRANAFSLQEAFHDRPQPQSS